jgi:methyl-accepting chemotaxis protein
MSQVHAVKIRQVIRQEKKQVYQKIAFMGASAVVVCAVIITYFNQAISLNALADFLSKTELAAVALMPYMISAVIAALTAVGVMSVLPSAQYAEPSIHLVSALRAIGDGDLSVRLKLKTDDPLRDVGNELNCAVDSLGSHVTEWKLLNRKQWGVLCRVRMAAEHGDNEDVLHFVQEMEKNWDKIAEIERSLTA